MSALAQILLARGHAVSGSDCVDGPLLAKLRALGARVKIGHSASHLDHPDVVVYSSAVAPHNPELIRARNCGYPVLSRGQMLAQLISDRQVVAVTGAHGKSTTTALIAELLLKAGKDPTVLLGAELDSIGGNARAGKGRYAVVEADESDGSFLWLRPEVAVITNLDEEHLDYFRNRPDIEAAYTAFAQRLRRGGTLIGCADDPWLMQLLPRWGRPFFTYGFSPSATFGARAVVTEPRCSRYRFRRAGREVGPIELHIPGRHNVQNSLAVLAVAEVLGISFSVAERVLAEYRGAHRRFEIHGEPRGILVVEDYGHHPAEIEATLCAAQAWGRRIWCVFQPHRYSRTRYLMERLARSFHRADEVILLPVYAASEDPLEGASTEALCAAMEAAGKKPIGVLSPAQALRYLQGACRAGDLVLFLGAGSVGNLARQFVRRLTAPSGRATRTWMAQR
jgi:UDP-N-acetylmuramate--alanine ligase